MGNDFSNLYNETTKYNNGNPIGERTRTVNLTEDNNNNNDSLI